MSSHQTRSKDTVSFRLDTNLLEVFDHKIKEKCFESRSKALTQLINDFVSEGSSEEKYNSQVLRWGVIWTAFDHHKGNVSQRLIDLQHEYQSSRLENVASLHFHVDKRNCLELSIVKGEEGLIHALIEKTRTIGDTKHSGGTLILPPDL